MATTTFLKKAKDSAEAGQALREAGVGVVEVEDWEEAAEELRRCEAVLVLCSGEPLDSAMARRVTRALSALAEGNGGNGLAPETARALSHELRTPLSAMAGWLHLIETGHLDEAGIKRALAKLRGNVDDQVRTIEKFLGNNPKAEGKSLS